MTSPVRSVLLAVLIVTGLAVAPARAADTVTAESPFFTFYGEDSAFVVAVCAAHASPRAQWTRVKCEVEQTHLVVSYPEAPPVFNGEGVHDASDTTASGPASAAVWVGNAEMPFTICTLATAAFTQNGSPVEITADPACVTINA